MVSAVEFEVGVGLKVELVVVLEVVLTFAEEADLPVYMTIGEIGAYNYYQNK